MAEIDDEMMLTPPAAERFSGLAVATLAKIRCTGGGPPYIKAGRKILYRRGDLIAWLNARRVKNTTEAARIPGRLTDGHEAA